MSALQQCPKCGAPDSRECRCSPDEQWEHSRTSKNDLTFRALREANIDRLPQFKNKHGGLAHSKADGSDWSPAQWLQAVVGELGEYANLRKKYERGDIDGIEFLVEAADELADVMTYLDILAFRIGVRLDVAVVDKFNRVSERVGATTRLTHETSDELPEALRDPLKVMERGRTLLEVHERETRSAMAEFLGWLSVDIAELHSVEAPRLIDSWDRYRAKIDEPPSPVKSSEPPAPAAAPHNPNEPCAPLLDGSEVAGAGPLWRRP